MLNNIIKKLSKSMTGENRPLVTDEPIEFEKEPAHVQDFRKITDHFGGIYGIYSKFTKKNRKMSTCDVLESEPLGFQLIMLKNLPRQSSKLLLLTLTLHYGHVRNCCEIRTCHRN